MKHDLIVIGGGAAGVMAAITARDFGIDTAILEGGERICKKLLSTGNGRCNITNRYTSPHRFHSSNMDFYDYALGAFGYKDTINFFSSLGLPLIELEDGKMYPMSLQSSSVVDIIRLSLEERAIPVYLSSKVKEIKITNSGFKLITNGETSYICNKLIIASGGKSAPKTGSDGSGYNLVKVLGHKIIPTFPALVQLKLNYQTLKALSGVKFQGEARIVSNNVILKKEKGEILFTDYGISGPPILQLSRTAADELNKKNNVSITVDILPEIPYEDIKTLLEGHWAIFPDRSIHDSLIGIINKKLIPMLLKQAGLESIHMPCSDLQWMEKRNIINLLKNWSFEVADTNSFGDSQVTAGGIDTKDINPSSMESKLIPGLYFAGEVLDVDGDCGGFNLQWAWCSGFLAGKNAAGK